MNIIHLLESSLSHSSSLLRKLSHTIDNKDGVEDAQARLSTLIQQAKDIEAALMTMTESSDTDELPEKLRHWGRKMLDLSLRNPLLNMRTGRSAIKLDCDDIALMEDHLDDGEELLLEQRELKGILSGCQDRDRRNGREHAIPCTRYAPMAGTKGWKGIPCTAIAHAARHCAGKGRTLCCA